MRQWMWRVFWVLSCIALVGTGVVGLRNGIVEWPGARTHLQQSVTAGVELYGVLGLVGGIGLAMRKRWSAKVALGWAVVVTYVPGAAVMGYGGADASWGSAIAATLGAGLTAAAVAYVAHRETQVERT
jgi:hypothetical protein